MLGRCTCVWFESLTNQGSYWAGPPQGHLRKACTESFHFNQTVQKTANTSWDLNQYWSSLFFASCRVRVNFNTRAKRTKLLWIEKQQIKVHAYGVWLDSVHNGKQSVLGCCCTHGVSRETAHLTPATRGRCLLPIQESYLKLKTIQI